MGWVLGQSCSLCAPHPVHPRPCAVWATAVSAAWATKGMAVCAQVSRDLQVRCPGPALGPGSTTSSLPPVADLCQKGHGGCSQHADCSQVGTVVTCTCLPDYEGDGWSCRARDPCLDGHRGGCSEHADCLNTGPVSRWGAKQPVCRGPTLPVSVRHSLSLPTEHAAL